MEKKNLFFNILLLIILIVLIVGAVFIAKKINFNTGTKEEQVVLKDIGYGSEISQIGYENADGIISGFLSAYNENNGKLLIQMMSLPATYIYSENDESSFDEKYEEIMKDPENYDKLVIMQYSLKQEENSILNGFSENNVKLELIENSQIEDVSKYLSKMTAKIRTISETEGIDEVDTLEFLLLHRDGAYHLMKYDNTDSEMYESYLLEQELDNSDAED